MRRLLNWLSRFLALLPVHEPEWVATGSRFPLGYQQILTGALGSAVGLTIPTTTTPPPTSFTTQIPPGFAIVQNTGTASARWRDDGTPPTATVGMLLVAGAELDYVGDVTKIQFIQAAGGAQLE